MARSFGTWEARSWLPDLCGIETEKHLRLPTERNPERHGWDLMNLRSWILHPLRKFWQWKLAPSLAFIADDIKSKTGSLVGAFLVLKASRTRDCNVLIQECNKTSLANTFNMFILMPSLLFLLQVFFKSHCILLFRFFLYASQSINGSLDSWELI